ncbi:MAG: chromosome partitioning protein ParB [Rhodospirillales bacterium 20-64-7]|nr:MAG: chromosome partitioning protein ParB [Rhodospirillales bacterium 20-64-7]
MQVEMVKIDLLAPSKWNPNVVSPDNETKLEESIKRHGFFKPVLAREVDGKLEIVGGEHRAFAAKRLGYKDVPVINLGPLTDKKAQELCLLDNGRYGNDDTLALAELLGGLGTADELAKFMPYSDTDLSSIFSSVDIELDNLDIGDEEDEPKPMREKPIQTHSIMRFKVPVEDQDMVMQVIERIVKAQKFTEADSLTNVGDALVYLCQNSKV